MNDEFDEQYRNLDREQRESDYPEPTIGGVLAGMAAIIVFFGILFIVIALVGMAL